jgi:hypothetical protein
MKKVIYLLIAVFVFGIVVASIPNKVKSTITIQAVENTVSEADLTKSANIISNRLKSSSDEKFDLKVITEKNQIQIKFSDKWDVNMAANLLVHKGTLQFCETYNKQELTTLLNGNEQLFSLLTPSLSDFQVGCTDIKNADKVIEYLKSLGTIQNCRFAWGPTSKKSEICLYALKTGKSGEALISGDDVNSVSSQKDEKMAGYVINMKFKSSGVERWSQATKQNINRVITIVLDGTVLCAPVVRSEINNGSCMITGNYTESEATLMATIIQNGELPAEFEFVK